MKTKFYALLLATAFVGIVFTGCGSSPEYDLVPGNPESRSYKAGKNVPLTDILICPQFNKNVNLRTWDGSDNETLFVISSEADFAKYSIQGHNILPKIDFSKNMFILIQGATNYGVYTINKSMVSLGSGKYILTAEIIHDSTCQAPPWQTAVVAPLLSPNAEVGLEVLKIY